MAPTDLSAPVNVFRNLPLLHLQLVCVSADEGSQTRSTVEVSRVNLTYEEKVDYILLFLLGELHFLF